MIKTWKVGNIVKITDSKKVEDCFDGSSIFVYWFDDAWQHDAIMNLRSLGELDYFPDFPIPFFRLRGRGGFQIKGVQGEDNCRVIFPKEGKEVIKQEFEEMFGRSFSV